MDLTPSLVLAMWTAGVAGGAAAEPTSIVRLDFNARESDILRRSGQVDIDAGFLSTRSDHDDS